MRACLRYASFGGGFLGCLGWGAGTVRDSQVSALTSRSCEATEHCFGLGSSFGLVNGVVGAPGQGPPEGFWRRANFRHLLLQEGV